MRIAFLVAVFLAAFCPSQPVSAQQPSKPKKLVEWGWDDLSKNFFKPEEFATTVRLGLEVSDEYVWIYTEQPRRWTNEKLPKEYVEALVKARQGNPPPK